MTAYNGSSVSYDSDGNMTGAPLSSGRISLTYDSTNRLISAGSNAYTYNAENARIKNVRGTYTTTYVYDTVSKLSRMLQKVTNGKRTKYVLSARKSKIAALRHTTTISEEVPWL